MKGNFLKGIFCVFMAWGCKESDVETNSGVMTRLQVVMPEGNSADGVKIEWTNQTTGVVYETTTNLDGRAECLVEPGVYRVTAQQRILLEGNREEMFTGGLNQVTVKDQVDTSLVMSHIQYSRLVIKEVYYVGCRAKDGSLYRLDNYLSIYNNSSDTVWLDGLGIGIVAPIRALADSPWLQDDPELRNVPIYRCGWLFPGDGHEHPLLPGKEVVIAVNAVDHTQDVSGSVDLSKADWAFYRDDFNPDFSKITPGVPKMSLVWLNWGGAIPPSYSIGSGAPGIMLYRIEGDVNEYVETHLRYEPGKPELPVYQYLTIPREWVLDYVECVESAQEVGHKRVPAVLDKSAVFVENGLWSGYSIHRKVAEVVGDRIIYQDTNDSANDFYEREALLKENRIE